MEYLSALALIVTILLVYLRIQKQEESSLRLQAENHRSRLKAEIFEKLSDVLSDWGDALEACSSSARSVTSSLRLSQKGLGVAPTVTANDVAQLHYAAMRATTSVQMMLERYEIVFLHFHDAHRALAEGHREALHTFSSLHSKLLTVLPLQHPADSTSTVGPLTQPTQPDLDALSSLADAYIDACGTLQGYVLDLGVEAQNELLGDLFGHTVPPRRPADSAVKVLQRSALPVTERPEGRWS